MPSSQLGFLPARPQALDGKASALILTPHPTKVPNKPSGLERYCSVPTAEFPCADGRARVWHCRGSGGTLAGLWNVERVSSNVRTSSASAALPPLSLFARHRPFHFHRRPPLSRRMATDASFYLKPPSLSPHETQSIYFFPLCLSSGRDPPAPFLAIASLSRGGAPVAYLEGAP